MSSNTNIEALLEQALEAAAGIDRGSVKSTVYAEIADIYSQSARPSRCLEILTQALHIADLLLHPEEKAVQLARLARIYLQTKDLQLPKELFIRAKLLAGAAQDPALKAGAMNQIAYEYLEAGLASEAEIMIHEIHVLAINPENGLDRVSELVNLSGICSDAGMSVQAWQLLEEASHAAAQTKDHWFKTTYFTSIAEHYAETGESNQAVVALQKAALATGSIEEASRPYFLLRIAQVYALLNLKAPACDILTTALGIVDQEELLFSKCDVLLNMAEIYTQVGEAIQANTLLAKVQDIIGDIDDLKDRISVYIKLSRSLYSLEQTGQASIMAVRALDLSRSVENPRTQIYLLGEMALLFIELNQLEKAMEIIHRIINIAQNPRIKTSGMSVIVNDVAEAHQYPMALLLAGVIHEPEARAQAYISLAKSQLPIDPVR